MLCVGLLSCVIWIRREKGALPDESKRILFKWWEGIKSCMHVIRENLNSRYISNSNIGKQSEDYCNTISIHQANSISEEKGTNGQRDTCILKNSDHDIYFVEPICELSPTATVICCVWRRPGDFQHFSIYQIEGIESKTNQQSKYRIQWSVCL